MLVAPLSESAAAAAAVLELAARSELRGDRRAILLSERPDAISF
jgi:hypothetical protein